jgi:hypothetical protein
MGSETNLILALMGLMQGANFWYLAIVNNKMTKLSNGCFARHIDLAKREGQNEATLKALHERTDRLEDAEIRIDARTKAADTRSEVADKRAVAADKRDVAGNERERNHE